MYTVGVRETQNGNPGYNVTSPFYSYTPGDNFDLASLQGPFSNPAIVNFIKAKYPRTRFPRVDISGYGSLGGTGDGGGIQDTPIGYNLTFSKFQQNHGLKWGFQTYYRRILTSGTTRYASYGGGWNFNGRFTNGPDPLIPTPNTGNPLADLELGLLSGGSIVVPSIERKQFSTYYAWFIQDDWRITPKLTLNLGLRYDFELSSREPNNYVTVFDPNIPSPIGSRVGPNTNGRTLNDFLGRQLKGVYVFGGSPEAGGDVRPAVTDMSALAPRLGFAYRLSDVWVLRGGIGKTFWPSTAGAHDNGQCPSCRASTDVIATIDGITPATTITNPFPGGLNEPTGTSLGAATRLGQVLSGFGSRYPRTPNAWQWNFNIQGALPSNTLLSVAYAGSRGRNLPCPTNICGDQLSMETVRQYGPALLETVANPFQGIITDPTSPLSRATVQRGQLLLYWPQYLPGTFRFPQPARQEGFPLFNEENPFRSSWDALLVSFEKRYSEGLQFTLAYTLSKSLTNSDSFVSWLGPVAGYQDVYNIRNEKSLSSEDTPHRFVIGHVYDLPFGKGKRFAADLPRGLNYVLGDWQFSGILTLQSGNPLPITVTPDNSGKRSGTLRPNLISTPQLASGSKGQKLNQWVNPGAFAQPAPFTLGNASRTLNIRGDGTQEYNMTLSKFFPITERIRTEFRTEYFNLFNRAHFAAPNMAFGSATFGRVSATVLPPRFIQFGLRVLW